MESSHRISKPFESRSANQLSKWLSAVGIDNLVKRHESGFMVVCVKNTVGLEIEVMPLPSNLNPPTGIRVFSSEGLRRGTQHKAIENFGNLSEELGYGRLSPLVRPLLSPKRRNDFLDSSIKHREFSRSVNPSPEVFDKFKLVMYKMAAKFYRKHYALNCGSGYTLEDIYSYCTIYLTTFESICRLADKSDEENNKLFYHYLAQRLEWLKICLVRNFKNEALIHSWGQSTGQETENIGEIGGRIYGSAENLEPENPDGEEWDVEGNSAKQRKLRASRRLGEVLSDLDKKDSERRLLRIVNDKRQEEGVRILAQQQLERLQSSPH